MCNDQSYYTGHTEDLEKRINEHENGRYAGYTSTRLPIKLIFHEVFYSRIEALEAEKKIKTWSRVKKETLIQHGWGGFLVK